MANGVKTFSIKINGIDTSIDAVKSLEKELFNLEQRIEAVSKQAVNIKSSGGGYGGGSTRTSNVSSLSEEEKLAKQIEQIDAKRIAYSKEIYQNYLAAKEVLSETVKDQKQLAASERLQAGTYSNTMKGMKQELADIKEVMQTVDLGDSDQFDKLTQRANELNEALKKIEESYGQFGRNVGIYKDAANGFNGLAIQIGDTTQNFETAKQAAKELGNELKTLQAKKDMGLISEEESKRMNDLIPVVAQLKSSIADAGKPMDALMDTMQSFVAIAQVSKGIGALFGIDDTEIQKSIQQLVALQNTLQGLQTIQKQIQSGEGVGGWIKPFNTKINAATNRLLAFNRALLGTGKAAKVASVGIKAFSKALKAAFSAGVLIVVDLLIEGLMDLVEKFKETSEEEKRLKEVTEAGAKAYAEAMANISAWKTKLEQFNGTKAQEKKLVEELNSKMGNSIGQYKTIAQMQKALTEKAAAYAESMKLQAQAQALLNAYSAQYVKIVAAQQDAAKGGSKWKEWLPWNWGGKSAKEKADDEVKELQAGADAILIEYNNINKRIEKINKENGLFEYSDQIEKGGKKTKNAVNDVEKEIAQARIAGMKEGLNKTITQLEEERKQRLAKLDKNSKDYKKYELQINNIYNQRILEATQEWNLKMEKTYSDMWKTINQDTLSNLKEQYELIKQYYAQSGQTTNNMDIGSPTSDFSRRNVIPSYGMLASKGLKPETKEALGLTATFDTTKFGEDMRKYVDLERQASVVMEEYYKKYEELQEKMKSLKIPDSEENDALLGRLNLELDETLKVHKKLQKAYIEYGKYVNDTYGEIKVRKRANLLYEEAYSDKLSTLFNQRNVNIEREQKQADKRLEDELKETTKKRKEIADKSYDVEYEAAKEHWNQISSAASSAYTEELSGLQAQLKKGLISRKQYNKLQDEASAQYNIRMKEILDNWHTTETNLETKHKQELIQIDQDANQKRQDNNKKSFEKQLQELRDFQTAIVNIESKQPVQNAWGITNFTETNKNNRNILDSYKTMVERINQMRADLNKKKNDGLIDDEMYSSTLRELDNLSQGIGEKMDEIKKKLSVGEQIGTFISDFQQYFNALGQGLQQIMQAVWSAEDAAFDREQEALNKENERIQDALKKNEEILERHSNNVNDIEDELSSARGDRRQHLIDQLNAETEAQREAAQEKKRIEKEQEALQRKQDALDKKRKEAQYKRDLANILVSGAMAAVNAYATKPFVPVGLTMGSLALALTAAQYAIAKSAKPYAHGGQLDGGVADGPRHSQGGIKVLGGRAEIEGGEFITNRTSTAKNIDLLEYVNSQKRKVDINDLIDFYSSGKPKKVVQSIRGRFAEGGNLPTLRTDIEVNDRLVSAFEDYAKTPSVVQVVDIIDRTKKVNNIKVLAGLSE